MRHSAIGTLALVGLIGLGAGACGSSGGGTGPGSTFTAGEAEGGAVVAEGIGQDALTTFTDDSYDAANLPSFSAARTPGMGSPLAGALYLAGVRGRALGHLALSPAIMRSTGSCIPTLSGDLSTDTPTDTDGDGVPDSVVATFTGDNCTVTDSASGTTFSYNGSIKIVDIGTLFGFRLVIDFTYVFQTASSTTTVHEVGTETFTVASQLADLNIQLDDTTSTAAGGPANKVLINETMEFQFVPTGDGMIVIGDPLPDGQMTITGGIGTSLQGQANSFSFDIATPTALAYSATCGNADDNPPFTAGHITGAFHGFATAGFDVTFTACGADPTVTTFGTSS